MGGASGLGAATAAALAADGAQVVVADVQDNAGSNGADLSGACYLQADVLADDEVQRAVDTAAEAPRGLRVLVVTAGVTRPSPLVRGGVAMGLADAALELSVNLLGTINVLRLAAASMTTNEVDHEGERGVCVLTSSMAAYDGQRGNVGYAAAKAGIAGLTLPAARDLARYGIRVVTVAPGIFETPMTEGFTPATRAALDADLLFPPRAGRATEYALTVRQIVENRMLNATVIRLDGGVRLSGPGPRTT